MRTESQVAAMQCPVCNVPLAMSAREGIEIDYCPQCRGVWLDRGELDKIIERSTPQPGPAPTPAPAASMPHGSDRTPFGHDERRVYGESYSGHYGKPYRKRKKSFLEELFD